MKKMHKRAMALCLTAALCSGLFAGCGGEKNTAETQQATEAQAADVQTESSDIYVEKIDGISDDFIRGMDASRDTFEKGTDTGKDHRCTGPLRRVRSGSGAA